MAVAGGAVAVPSVLAGVPDPFVTLETSESVGAVGVWVSTQSGGSVPDEKVRERERAILGVVKAVAAKRPALIEAMIDPVSYPTTPEALVK